jgi:hypothetical protein
MTLEAGGTRAAAAKSHDRKKLFANLLREKNTIYWLKKVRLITQANRNERHVVRGA